MKNLSTLFAVLFLFSFNINAQNTQCIDAQLISGSETISVSSFMSGQYPPNSYCTSSSGSPWGARWYLYQPSVDGLATVTSDLISNSNVDTRVTVYSGDCANLTCLYGNDDIDGVNNKFSEVSFPVSIGSSYYIVWDNANYGPPSAHPAFDFSLTETAVDCSAISLPINEDFDSFNSFTACLSTENADSNFANFEQRSVDWDGDGTDENYAENGSTSNVAKNDWLFSTPINLVAGHQYNINFKYNGADGTFSANENLDVMFMDGKSSGSTTLTTLFSATGIVKNGTNQQTESMATSQSIDYTSTSTGTYYLAFNATSPPNTGSLLLFEYSVVDNTLDINEFELAGLSKSFDASSDVLTIKSNNSAINGIEIYDILGQKIIEKPLSQVVENVNLSDINDGIYIIKISLPEYIASTKLLKR